MTFTDPTSFDQALKFAQSKQLLPTSMSSREIQQLGGDVTRRATLSARVSVAEILQKIKDGTEKIAGGITEGGAVAGQHAAGDRMVSPAEMKAQLKELAQSLGWSPENPDDIDTIKDIRGSARLQLIVETNVLDTMNAGRWEAGQDEVALEVNPALELVRVTEAKMPRDWEERWDEARAATIEDGSTSSADGRMVALKNHPIWQALGDGEGGFNDTLGNPWPPFAFNSGMGTLEISREEAVGLGLMNETTQLEPEDRGLNDSFEVSAGKFDAELARAIAAAPGLQLSGGVLTVRNRGVAANSEAAMERVRVRTMLELLAMGRAA